MILTRAAAGSGVAQVSPNTLTDLVNVENVSACLLYTSVSRTNRALETTDALSDQVNPGANFDRAASARASAMALPMPREAPVTRANGAFFIVFM